MMAQVAKEIIDRATFAPDIELRVKTLPALGSWPRGWGGEAIQVEIIFRTFDSSQPDEDGKYRERRTIAPVFTLEVEDLHTEEELLHDVIHYITYARQHEDREFTRVKQGGKWVAPFHPHTPSKDLAWNRAEVEARRRLPYYSRV